METIEDRSSLGAVATSTDCQPTLEEVDCFETGEEVEDQLTAGDTSDRYKEAVARTIFLQANIEALFGAFTHKLIESAVVLQALSK